MLKKEAEKELPDKVTINGVLESYAGTNEMKY